MFEKNKRPDNIMWTMICRGISLLALIQAGKMYWHDNMYDLIIAQLLESHCIIIWSGNVWLGCNNKFN